MGRAQLLARLDQLLIADSVGRWVVVIGGPGMGKSAVLARWLTLREEAGDLVPHHFIRRNEYDWDDPVKLVDSLVAQIEARFSHQREPEGDARRHPAARLDATLRRISSNELGPRGERLVVLIDGLDEYDAPEGAPAADPLAAFLPHALPRGVSILCACRPRHPYVDMLAKRGAVTLDLDDEHSFAVDNDATVRAFWNQAAPELGIDATFIDAAVERADGNLQHAAMLRQHLDGVPLEQRRLQDIEDIPRGLEALITAAWERIATEKIIVDGLGILCAAREALTLDEIGLVAGWDGEPQRRTFLKRARELLLENRCASTVREYRLHHDSIRAQITVAIGSSALQVHHRTLASKLAAWPPTATTTQSGYALRHALLHRAEAEDWADAWRVATDMSFLEAKCRSLGAYETEADVTRIAARCPANWDEALHKRFGDLARALALESRWLRIAPGAIPALVWNQLRQAGWTADDIDKQLRIPSGSRFLRVRHVARRPDLRAVREPVGHAGWVRGCAVTADGRRVLSASENRTVKVWDLETGRVLATLEGHTRVVFACAVTADGQRAVSASDDRTVRVWDLATGSESLCLAGHLGGVRGCAVTADGRRVVSTSR